MSNDVEDSVNDYIKEMTEYSESVRSRIKKEDKMKRKTKVDRYRELAKLGKKTLILKVDMLERRLVKLEKQLANK